MTRTKSILGLLLLLSATLAFGTPLAFGEPSMSDGQAKSLVETSLHTRAVFGPMQGDYDVVSERQNWREGRISEGTYKNVIALSKTGLLSVALDSRYEDFKKGKGFGLDQWMQLTTQNVIAKISISPTPEGQKLALPGDEPNSLYLPTASHTVTSVVKNEGKQKGVDDYRLIMVAYTKNYHPLYKQFAGHRGLALNSSRKAIVLFKWDPFASKWVLVAVDDAASDENFTTSNVATRLGS